LNGIETRYLVHILNNILLYLMMENVFHFESNRVFFCVSFTVVFVLLHSPLDVFHVFLAYKIRIFIFKRSFVIGKCIKIYHKYKSTHGFSFAFVEFGWTDGNHFW